MNIPAPSRKLAAVAAIMSLALAFPGMALAKTAAGKSVVYRVKPGDTLIELAQRYMHRPSHYRIVQKLNHIHDPRRLAIGKRLVIPRRLLKYKRSRASISAFRGDVVISSKGRRHNARKGLAIPEGSRLGTAANSFVTLRLADGSNISMPSNSSVRINRLRKILLTGSVDYEFSVENGGVRSKINPFTNRHDSYRVRTPVAVSAVRGTDYRARVDHETGKAFTETVKGIVAVTPTMAQKAGRTLETLAGKGVSVSGSGDVKMAELLAPPSLADPAKVQSEKQLAFAIDQREEEQGYRLQLSSDAGFVDILSEKNSPRPQISMAAIPDGRYFVKATAYSGDGFEGMPAVYAFKRLLNTVKGSASKGDFGYRFKWGGEGAGTRLYHFQLLRGSKTAVPMVDENGLTVDNIVLSDLPAGDYFWRVGVTQFLDGEASSKWTDFEKLIVAG